MKTPVMLLIMCLFSCSLKAQIDTINTQTNSLTIARIKAGTSKYLYYSVNSLTNETQASDIWERSVSFGNRNQQPTVNFEWKWYHRDSLFK